MYLPRSNSVKSSFYGNSHIQKYEHEFHKVPELNGLNMIDRRQFQMIILFNGNVSDKCPSLSGNLRLEVMFLILI